MPDVGDREPWRPGKYILRYRALIGIVLILVTAFMGYWVKFQQRYQNSRRIFLNRRIVKNFYGISSLPIRRLV